jgi:hypothetical protein
VGGVEGPGDDRKYFLERGKGPPDVYRYDQLPNPLRVQIVHIWQSAIGRRFCARVDRYEPSRTIWNDFEEYIAREHGLLHLGTEVDGFLNVGNYFLQLQDVPRALDVVEVTARAIDTTLREHAHNHDIKQSADSAIDELNHRFREHGIGYQYLGGEIVRVDSQLVHREVVRPALQFLQDAKFRGAEEEFLNAHAHYRAGRTKEALNDALKAFESAMKGICTERRWPFNKKATAKDLLDVLFKNRLIDSTMQNHFAGLRATLEGGLPTVRNTRGGHGQGSQPLPVPEHITAYALHLAAANIVFLVEAHKAMK